MGVRLIGDSANKAAFPSDEALVVRYAAEGIGLAFIEIEVDDDID